MNFCECGCGNKCTKRFVSGHNRRNYKVSVETREKNRQARLNQKNSAISNEKNRQSQLGKIVSTETRKKMSQAMKGNTNSVGVVQSAETRKKRSISMQGNTNYLAAKTGQFGKTGLQHSTSIEKMMRIVLGMNNVEYAFQVPVGRYIVDMIIPKLNQIIECDGCYWHRCEECGYTPTLENTQKQEKRDRYLKEKGYKILHLMEHDIKDIYRGMTNDVLGNI